MKYINLKSIIAGICFFSLSACESLLIENPPSNISLASFYQNESDALSGLNGAYSELYSIYNGSFIDYSELMADDLKGSYINANNIFDVFNINNETMGSLWQNAFQGVNLSNEVILYTERINASPEKKSAIIAEARALRALYYFNLVRAFGGVPVYTTPTVGFENIYNPRATADEVYKVILEDLKNAEKVLSPTSKAGRFNSLAATALLARIYLYRGDFTNALASAKKVIDSGKYRLLDDYADVFKTEKKNSPEHIFQVQYLSGDRNTSIPGAFGPRPPAGSFTSSFWAQTIVPGNYEPEATFVAENPNSYRKNVTLSNSYLHINGSGKLVTMKDVYKGSFPYYISKFDDRAAELQSGQNFNIIRYADILLIAAEAANEVEPNNSNKYVWINLVRERARRGVEADLPDLKNLSQSAFRTAVWNERRFELAFEGQRAWDLKRTGRFLKTLEAQGKNIKEYMLLLPIPNNQIKLNPNLKQNPGW
jgi:starch-binding outer membrane protein, SusD/RagB family